MQGRANETGELASLVLSNQSVTVLWSWIVGVASAAGRVSKTGRIRNLVSITSGQTGVFFSVTIGTPIPAGLAVVRPSAHAS